jgi:acetate kinase
MAASNGILALLGPAATIRRVIFAHLGNGASLAAVRDGKSTDTSMGFTPAAGLVMSTCSGDLDPGLVSFIARSEQMTTSQCDQMINPEPRLRSFGDQLRAARLARAGSRWRTGGGSRGAVLTPSPLRSVD